MTEPTPTKETEGRANQRPLTVIADRQLKALLWPLLAWSAWAHAGNVVAGTKYDGGALVTVRLVGVGSVNIYGD